MRENMPRENLEGSSMTDSSNGVAKVGAAIRVYVLLAEARTVVGTSVARCRRWLRVGATVYHESNGVLALYWLVQTMIGRQKARASGKLRA